MAVCSATCWNDWPTLKTRSKTSRAQARTKSVHNEPLFCCRAIGQFWKHLNGLEEIVELTLL